VAGVFTASDDRTLSLLPVIAGLMGGLIVLLLFVTIIMIIFIRFYNSKY